MNLWIIRLPFLVICAGTGLATGALRPDWLGNPFATVVGLALGVLLIGIDEMLKGFSLRSFSAATFGLALGFLIAAMVDRAGVFDGTPEDVRQLIRVGLFLSLGYVGIVMALRSNKDDFSLIIPYVRFKAQNQPENLLLFDTSVIIDARIGDLIEGRFVEGVIVVPKFVLKELQTIADSPDAVRRARGQRGLELLKRLQRNPRLEVKIHEADIPQETEVDAKLVGLARTLSAKLYTNDYNLASVAELQSVPCINLHKLALALKPAILPGETLHLRITREGKEKGQGLAYLNDGTMVVVNQAQPFLGQAVQAQVQSVRQTGAGVMIFADLKMPTAA